MRMIRRRVVQQTSPVAQPRRTRIHVPRQHARRAPHARARHRAAAPRDAVLVRTGTGADADAVELELGHVQLTFVWLLEVRNTKFNLLI